MTKYEAEIHGTLEFKRKISVYATNETDAKIVAEELTIKSIEENIDKLTIHEIKINLPKDVNIFYSIGVKENKD